MNDIDTKLIEDRREMTRVAVACAVVIGLSACTPGGNGQVNTMMSNGHMNIEAGGPRDQYDYKMIFLNVWDVTYDLYNETDRQKFIYGALPDDCTEPKIINEHRIVNSRAITGREMANYTIFIDC